MGLSFIFLAFLSIGLTNVAEAHWGYPDLDKKEEFPKWGGLCDNGTHQSPINLSIRGALKGEFQRFDFQNYSKETTVQMVNNGHSIQLYGFSYQMQLRGGPLLDEYVLEQIHLHWWSEHTVESIRYPLEAHLVHRNKRYPDMDEATKHKNGVTVIGVLYHVSNEENSAIDAITDHLDDVRSAEQLNVPKRWSKPFVVRELFPKYEGYFTYAGSLTTPGCDEAVTWVVLKDSFPVTLEQIDKFKEIEIAEGQPLKNNYRNIQESNRVVVIVTSEYDGNGASLHTSLLTMLLVPLVAKLLQ